MGEKQQAIAALREVYERWEALLASRDEAAIMASRSPDMSIQDTIAHLWAWQQVTAARLEAAVDGNNPVFPAWVEGDNPDEGDVNDVNARIAATTGGKPWTTVYHEWRAQFLRVLELAEAVPEHDFVTAGKYRWVEEPYVLLDVLKGSREHHEEHLEPLLATNGGRTPA